MKQQLAMKEIDGQREFSYRLLTGKTGSDATEIQRTRSRQPLGQTKLQDSSHLSSLPTITSSRCYFGLCCVGAHEETITHWAKGFTKQGIPVCATANCLVNRIGFNEYGAIIALLELSETAHRLVTRIPFDDLGTLRQWTDGETNVDKEWVQQFFLRTAQGSELDNASEVQASVYVAPTPRSTSSRSNNLCKAIVALLELSETAHRLVTEIPFDDLRALAELKKCGPNKVKWLQKNFFSKIGLHTVTQIDTAGVAELANLREPAITMMGKTKPANQPSPQLGTRTAANPLCHFKWQCLGCREGTKVHLGSFRICVGRDFDGNEKVVRVCKTAQGIVNTFGYDEYVAQMAKKGRSRKQPPSLSSTTSTKKQKGN